MNQANYFMVIPAVVWNADISTNAKLTYGHISVLTNSKGYCFATNKYLADRLGVVKQTVSKYISELQNLGVIKTEIRLKPGTKEVQERRIFLSPGLIGINEMVNTPLNEMVNTPINENAKGNNKSINNKNINNKRVREARPYTINRVIDFFLENGSTKLEAERYYDYFTANGWVMGKSKAKIKDWKAAARNWIKRSKDFEKPKKTSSKTFSELRQELNS